MLSLKWPERDKTAMGGTRQTNASAPHTVRPFLKWAGGKRQLLPEIRRFYPKTFKSYLEPFVGSGAVFFDLCSRGRLAGHSSTLLDSNSDLVGCYLNIRDHRSAVVKALSRLATARTHDPEGHYYRVRDEKFNPQRKRLANGRGPNSQRYSPSLTAMLIYLNRTGFNGLFRLNSKGCYNVPIGRYKNPTICDADNLTAVEYALSSDVEIQEDHFETTLDLAKKHDFVYFDPPYAPLTRTAHFTSYTATGFSASDQERLQQVVIELARRGCFVLLSNSTAPDITRLYDGNPATTAVGLRAYKVPARRTINSTPNKRGTVLEYLITNVPRGPNPN